jgi:orotate phosphoribosyltransferase
MNRETVDRLGTEFRRIVAMQLWHLGAVKTNLEEPFRLASGNYSPIYVNCRQLISSPSFVHLFAAAAGHLCERDRLSFEVAAGGETAGIPFAAFLAQSLGKSLVYVRKAAKGYGLASRIEGQLKPGARVLLVEDLITDAGSKISFIEAIREAGGTVEDVLVVFDRLQGGAQALRDHGVSLHAISDMEVALEVAADTGVLSESDLGSVKAYLASPREWHLQQGLEFQD